MTTLVLGTALSMAGNAILPGIGGQIGFLVGSLLGNLIDPPKVEGPRRSDLKLQRSEFGQMLPFVWGTGRIAGNVLDQTDLQEHKETSGGKGGPEVTTYTYSASFLVGLAATKRFGDPAIAGIRRIWADGRLIWSLDTGGDMPCTLYLGTETQEPDPTFEAINGIGQQPAYRGMAYVVFADYMLTDFGDRIPLLEFEVYTEAGSIPWRVYSYSTAAYGGGLEAVTYDGTTLTVGGYYAFSSTYFEKTSSLDGSGAVGPTSTPLSPGLVLAHPCWNAQIASSGAAWYARENGMVAITANPGGGSVGSSVTGDVIYQNNFLYAVGNTSGGHPFVAKWPCTDGVLSAESGMATAVYDFGSGAVSTIVLGTSNTDYIYVLSTISGSGVFHEFDADLNLLRSIPCASSDTAGKDCTVGSSFYVFNDIVCFDCDAGVDGRQAAAFRIETASFTLLGAISSTAGPVVGLNNGGLCAVTDGIISLIPPAMPALLSTIVTDLSDMTQVGSYDVTELIDEVRWYAVGTQTTVRNAIDPLRRGFFFDAVESDDTAVFRKRDATDSVVTVSDDDLDAREYGSEPNDLLTTTRKREQGMPRNVTLRYIDVDMDYQTGAQHSPRLTTLSDSDVTLDLAIGFTTDEALQKCWKLQVSEWIERESFIFSTTRKYAEYEPCDKMTVRGRVIRITHKSETPAGVITFEGVLHRPSIYTQEQTGSGSSGFTEQTTALDAVPTEAVLLDIPILSQDHAPFGFYAAMGPSRDGPWSGVTLYKSLDGGVSYFAIASSNVPSIIGVTANTDTGSPVGSPTVGGALPAYYGGDVVEEYSICVVLTDDDAELTSTNATGLANGMNLCAISRGSGGSPIDTEWELLQFRDATFIDTKTYILSGFMRGRKGTLTTNHAEGDRFVLLPVTNVDAPEADINHEHWYKAVTFGRTLANTAAFVFTNTGLGATEFYETEVENLPVYGGTTTGSPPTPSPGIVPPPHGSGCDSTYFLNECGQWAIPPGVPVSAMVVITNSSATGTVTLDLSSYAAYPIVIYDATLTGNITFNITNGTNGQVIRCRFRQDGTGGRTFTAGANLRFSTDIPSLTLTTTLSKIDRVAFEWDGAASKADILATNKGF